MPVYCYKAKDGEVVDKVFRMGKAPKKITLADGRVAERSFQAENLPRAAGRGWPMEPCFASGVSATQAPELRKFFADHGCKTEVTNDGDPIYTSPGHRKKALKLRGMYDKSGY